MWMSTKYQTHWKHVRTHTQLTHAVETKLTQGC